MSPATAGLVIIVTVVKIVIELVKFHGLEVYSIPQNTCKKAQEREDLSKRVLSGTCLQMKRVACVCI